MDPDFNHRDLESFFGHPQSPLVRILDAVADGITVQDKTGKLVYANTTGAAIIGYDTPHAMVSTSLNERLEQIDVMDEYGAPLPSERFPGRLAMQGQESDPVTLQTRHKKTGRVHWSRVQARTVRTEARDIEFVVTTFHDITPQKHIEDQLKTSEENYRELVENANDMIYTMDLNGHLTSLNQAGEQLLGYQREELLHTPLIRLVVPEDVAIAQAMIDRKLTSHERTRYELSLRTKDGRVVTLDVNSRPTIRHGRALGIHGIGRDITARKRVEAQQRFLADASTRLAASLDYETTLAKAVQLMTPTLADWAAIDVVTDQGGIQRVAVSHVNPNKVQWAYEIHRRYPVDIHAPRGVPNVIRTGQSEFYPLMDQAMIAASARDAEMGRIFQEVGFRSAIIVPLITQAGALGAMTLVTTIDSERRFDELDLLFAEELGRMAGLAMQNARLYREAQLQREQLQVTLASIGDAVIATDIEGSVTFMNAVSEELTGWTQPEAMKKSLTEVFHIINEYTRDIAEDPVQKVFEKGVIAGLANHTLLLSRHGHEIPIEDSAAPIRDLEGKIVGAVLVFRDASEERQGQAALRQARAEAEAAHLNLHNLFMEAPALIAILRGPEGHVELFNPLFTQLWGHRDVIGKTFREAFYELEGQGWFEIREQVYATGQSIVGTEKEAFFDRNNDGELEQMFFNFVYQATHNAEGAVDGVAIYGVEVTDHVLARKRAEALAGEVRSIQERLQLMIDSAKDYAIFALDVDGQIISWNAGAERVFGYTDREIVGQNRTVLFTDEDRARGIPEEEMNLVIEFGYAENERWLLGKERRLLYTSGMVRTIQDNTGQLQGFIKVVRDTTPQHLARQRTLLLQRLAADLSAQLKSNDIADTIGEYMHEAVGGIISIFLLRPESQSLERLYTRGLSQAVQKQYPHFSIEAAYPIAEAVRTQQVIWIPDQADYITHYPHLRENLIQHNIHGTLCLPLLLETQLVGGLTISFNKTKVLSSEDRELVEAIAHLGAQALERARLYEQAQAAAALRERQRLARDLHDAVSQTLFSAMILSESLPRVWQRDPERAFPLIEQVHILNKAAAAEMRVLLWELRPEALENTPLEELYAQLTHAIRGRKQMDVSLDLQVQSELSLPLSVHVAFYRIAQEAINNVVKHSQAKHFTLRLISLLDRVELYIIDDGIGFENTPGSGIGMGSMRERAEEIKATLTVNSRVDKGTEVVLIWHRP
jgi:PAS domain S-box-containing protein